MNQPGFIEALFDYSFRSFVVVRIVGWLYRAIVVIAVLSLIGSVVIGGLGLMSAQSNIDALAATGGSIAEIQAAQTARWFWAAPILISPVLSVFLVLGGRVAAEVTIVLFKIAEALTKPGGN